MDDRNDFYRDDEQPAKKRWAVQKMPIKGGSVLRSAQLIEIHHHTPQWVQEEGIIEV